LTCYCVSGCRASASFPTRRSSDLMLTSYAEDELVMDAVRAGAVGYVLKRVGSTDLVDAIRTVGKGDALIDPSMTKALLEEVRQADRKSTRLNSSHVKISYAVFCLK